MVPATTSTVRLTWRSSISSSRVSPTIRHGLTLGVAVGGSPPHVDGHLAHPLHQPRYGPKARSPGHGGPSRHVLGQVTVPLEVREHPDHRDQEPQVLGRGDAGHRELLQGQLLDLVIEGRPPRPGRPRPWPLRGHRRSRASVAPDTDSPPEQQLRTLRSIWSSTSSIPITVLPPVALPPGSGGQPARAPRTGYPWPPLASRIIATMSRGPEPTTGTSTTSDQHDEPVPEPMR